LVPPRASGVVSGSEGASEQATGAAIVVADEGGAASTASAPSATAAGPGSPSTAHEREHEHPHADGHAAGAVTATADGLSAQTHALLREFYAVDYDLFARYHVPLQP
jgi:hypothetical protein